MPSGARSVVGKRSTFPRRKADAYLTWDVRPVLDLLPHLAPATRYREPCVGQGHLVAHLAAAGHECTYMADLPDDARLLPVGDDPVITNPPWTRPLLHEMILRFTVAAPYTWLLFDAGWAYTAQSGPYMALCTDMVPCRRTRWIEGSKDDATDDCAWYRFSADGAGVTRFRPRG